MDGADIVAGENDAPVATMPLQDIDHGIATNTAFWKYGKRKCRAVRQCRAVRGDPDKWLVTDDNVGGSIFAARDQGKVDQIVLQSVRRDIGIVANDIDLHIGKFSLKGSEDLRQEHIGIVIGCADADAAMRVGLADLVYRLLAQGQDPARIVQQCLAFARQLHPPGRTVEKLLADRLLEPLDLHADGRLGPQQPVGASRKALGVEDGDEGAKQLDVDDFRHGRPFVALRPAQPSIFTTGRKLVTG